MGNNPSNHQSDLVPIHRPLSLSSINGCLLGIAIGDSIGCALEGNPHSELKPYINMLNQWKNSSYPTRISLDKLFLNNKFLVPANGTYGQVTDDTQLTLILARSLISCNSFNPNHFAQSMAQTYKQHKLVGAGRGTADSLTKLLKGVNYTSCGSGSAGNGSAIRSTILGLVYCNNNQLMTDYSIEQSRITHIDKRAIAGAIIMANAISLCATEFTPPQLSSSKNRDLFLINLAKSCESVHSEFAEYCLSMIQWFNKKISLKEVTQLITRAGLDKEFNDGSVGISGFVIPSVLWALYCFLKHSQNYWTALSECLLAGGDTDSTGALCGALSGAYLGYTGNNDENQNNNKNNNNNNNTIDTKDCNNSTIPECFAQLVHDQEEWTSSNELTAIAKDLLKLHKSITDNKSVNNNNNTDDQKQ